LCHSIFGLLVALSPDEQIKSILATIVLVTIHDEPVRIESLGYGFTGPVAIRDLLPLVTTNARRKAIGYLGDYIASSHSDLAGDLAFLEIRDGYSDFFGLLRR